MIAEKLQRWRKNGITAAAQVFYIPNNKGVPDYRQTDLISRTEAYIDSLPKRQYNLLSTLFVFAEMLLPKLYGYFGKWSLLPQEKKEIIMKKVQKSRFYLVRSIYDSLRAVMAMMYLSHSDALAFIGHYKTQEVPGDELEVIIKKRNLAKRDSRAA